MGAESDWYVRISGVQDVTSAGGIVARRENGRVLIALVCEYDHPGYVLPKGHVEPGESIEEAARREVGEEAGIHELTLVQNLGARERMNFERTKWKTIHYFLFTTRQVEHRQLDPQHHRFGWFPIDALPDMFWKEQRMLIEENRDLIEHATCSEEP